MSTAKFVRDNRETSAWASRYRDVLGRLKVTMHQNIYAADFEYGKQPLRWEEFTTTGGSCVHLPGDGGVRLAVDTQAGAIAIRQSRPYHRYQPGKAMFMATAHLFGAAQVGNTQRVGFFDDANGAFFEQGAPDPAHGNPSGMSVVVRSDLGGLPVDFRVPFQEWNSPNPGIRQSLDFNRIQMLWIEYAWYGAGQVRFGCYIDGEPYILHQISYANRVTPAGANQLTAWARTGNLPVRYETRNSQATAAGNSVVHYGVSVLVEGRVDAQRGFTYSYGMAPASPRRTVSANTARFPVMSIRARTMGAIEFTQAAGAIQSGATTTSMTVAGTPFTANALVGRKIHLVGPNIVARITANTNNTITYADLITGGAIASAPSAGTNYSIGIINRGQLLPQRLLVSASALCVVELVCSSPAAPIVLNTPTWAALSSLGSANSFAERDVSSTAITSGGEVVFAFTAPAGGSGLLALELDQLFPLYNTIRGNVPDVLTVAVSTPTSTAADVGAHIICQEEMS